mmetsp:Transcript_31157/g.89021  ORF Transcript_31157/g.89021 Transcript_31157/m.89021 type:complete len:210 (+) Transcript_31157:336-965(+)
MAHARGEGGRPHLLGRHHPRPQSARGRLVVRVRGPLLPMDVPRELSGHVRGPELRRQRGPLLPDGGLAVQSARGAPVLCGADRGPAGVARLLDPGSRDPKRHDDNLRPAAGLPRPDLDDDHRRRRHRRPGRRHPPDRHRHRRRIRLLVEPQLVPLLGLGARPLRCQDARRRPPHHAGVPDGPGLGVRALQGREGQRPRPVAAVPHPGGG